MAQKSMLTFHWLKLRHWNALAIVAMCSNSCIDSNAHITSFFDLDLEVLEDMMRGGQREGADMKGVSVLSNLFHACVQLADRK